MYVKLYSELQTSFTELMRGDPWKFITLQALAHVLMPWFVVTMSSSEGGTQYVFIALFCVTALELVLMLLMSSGKRVASYITKLWKLIIFTGSAVWFWLGITPNLDIQPVSLWVLAIVLTGVIYTILYADSLNQAQKGSRGQVKLILYVALAPFIQAMLLSASGVIAESNIQYVFLMASVLYFAMGVVLFKHEPLHSARKVGSKFFQKIGIRQMAMLVQGGIKNGITFSIKFVAIPLYVFEKTGGNPAKFGLVLALFALVVMLANVLSKFIKGHFINTEKFMFVTFLPLPLMLILWGMYVDNVWVVFTCILVMRVFEPLWSFGFFAEYHKCDPEHSTLQNVRNQLATTFCVCSMSIALAFYIENMMELLSLYLIVGGTVNLVLWSALLGVWRFSKT